MKIAVVCPYDLAAPGGVQDQVIGLVERLGAAGHQIWAVAPGKGGPAGTRHIGGVIRVPANRSTAPVSLSPRTRARVRAAVEDAEVVHVHEPFMPMASLGVLRSGPPPSVGTFHADPGAVVGGIYRGAAPVLRRLAARLDLVTAVSETARAAISHFAEARVIPNGVDVAGFRDAPGERDPLRVVFIGRDEPRKGLDVLLEAWPRVRADHPGATLTVIGADRGRRPDGVAFLGRIGDEQKRCELASAAVLAAPNLGGESFGIILIEAMAAGCAVVASNLAAFRAVAAGAGLLVEPGDAAALATGLGALLGDPDRTAALAATGAGMVEQYDWSRVSGAYLAAYREVVAAAG
ncbi:MAG: glycosyltransferase family 4 protein [Actinobacteria bacterium]|nr:glycosyltransferase family 4 protein [Actinomycetota bacterium]